LTPVEKAAMAYLGFPAMDLKFEHLDWPDLDEETRKMARILGYEPHKWDDDWELVDLPCEEWSWADMTVEQREAAVYFGYTEVTWECTIDGTNYQRPGSSCDTAEPAAASVPPPPPPPSAPTAENKDEKKEQEGDKQETETDSEPKPSTAQPSKPKIDFKISPLYGRVHAGDAFDHHNHRGVKKITIIAGTIVDGLIVEYGDSKAKHEHGGKGGLQQGDVTAQTYHVNLAADEHIIEVFVRADTDSFVQAIGFTTSAGNKHGPWGGKGRLLKNDKVGKEHIVKAPKGYKLTGFVGRADRTHITAIGFRWGPFGK